MLIRHPFVSLPSLSDELDRFLGGFLGEVPAQHPSPACLPVDLWEQDDRYTVEIEVPGLKAGDLEVAVEEGVLKVRGERKAAGGEGRKLLRAERFAGRFERQIALPAEVDASGVEAALEDGVLRVTLRKAESEKTRKVPIRVVA